MFFGAVGVVFNVISIPLSIATYLLGGGYYVPSNFALLCGVFTLAGSIAYFLIAIPLRTCRNRLAGTMVWAACDICICLIFAYLVLGYLYFVVLPSDSIWQDVQRRGFSRSIGLFGVAAPIPLLIISIIILLRQIRNMPHGVWFLPCLISNFVVNVLWISVSFVVVPLVLYADAIVLEIGKDVVAREIPSAARLSRGPLFLLAVLFGTFVFIVVSSVMLFCTRRVVASYAIAQLRAEGWPIPGNPHDNTFWTTLEGAYSQSSLAHRASILDYVRTLAFVLTSPGEKHAESFVQRRMQEE